MGDIRMHSTSGCEWIQSYAVLDCIQYQAENGVSVWCVSAWLAWPSRSSSRYFCPHAKNDFSIISYSLTMKTMIVVGNILPVLAVGSAGRWL